MAANASAISNPHFDMSYNPDKDVKLYYNIGEVATLFDVNETTLRFWEKEFPNLSPKKTGRGIRQYTKADLEQVRIVHNLVKVRGLKIAAARELLRKNKSGTMQTIEVVDRLRAIRQELQLLKNAFDSLA